MRAARAVSRRLAVFVYPRLQYWHQEMLNNAEMHRQWKESFRVSSRPTFDQFLRRTLNNKQDDARAVPLQKREAVALWRLETGNAFILLTKSLKKNLKTNKLDPKSAVNKHADDQTCSFQHFMFRSLLIGSALFVVR